MVKVAVIGAGPGGLFFCNAIEHLQNEEGSPGAKDVEVVCFERSSQPGGVWRSGDSSSSSSSTTTTDMYDNLWSNGASHCLELFDYTFDEAFGKPVPVYLKREEIHAYIIGRMKKNCNNGDFFAKYVRFLQNVELVTFDKESQQFILQVKDLTNNTMTSHSFDKCIWACGENGKQNMPQTLVALFREGGFKGTLMHSSDAANAELFETSVTGKRILLIGGGYSAEDLALQAIKVGVDKVFVSSRDSYSDTISTVNSWPGDKVEVLPYQTPLYVTDEGTCIQFHGVAWSPEGYKHLDIIETQLRDIDTVIFCTGYDVNLSMLDKDLNEGFPRRIYKVSDTVAVPKDWKMPENAMTTYVGDVPLSDHIRYYTGTIHPRFYNGILISNPNMMFMGIYECDLPIQACEAYAWLFAGYVTGRIEMPSVEEMKCQNQEEALRQLGMPYYRYQMDDNYWKAVDFLDIWPDEYGECCPPWDECEHAASVDIIKRLAGVFHEAKYPVQIGTREELNEHGRLLFNFEMEDDKNRRELVPTNVEKEWRTFRDDPNPERFYSLFTGTKAVPLEDKWINIDKKPTKKRM